MPDIWLGFLHHSHTDVGRFTPGGATKHQARTGGRVMFVPADQEIAIATEDVNTERLIGESITGR